MRPDCCIDSPGVRRLCSCRPTAQSPLLAPGWSADSTNWQTRFPGAIRREVRSDRHRGLEATFRVGALQAAPRCPASSGASQARGSSQESGAEFAARLETEIGNVLGVAHALLEEGTKLAGGLWIITERAVATEPGEPVDPVQAAFWGLGRTIIAEQPGLRCRLVDSDGSDDVVHALAGLLGAPPDEPELALRQGKCLVPRLLPWARGGQLDVPRSGDYVLAPTQRGALDNLRLTETEVPPPAEGYVQVRVQAAGLNFRDVLNALGLYPGDPGPIGGELAGIVAAVGSGRRRIRGRATGFRLRGRERSPAGSMCRSSSWRPCRRGSARLRRPPRPPRC